jgi:flavin reductase (DIM6/NTAB) family NADH-FMN oxidoreductase RutF
MAKRSYPVSKVYGLLELAAQVVDCGNTSGQTLDKFVAFGLTQEASTRVTAPRIKEC